jgi:Tol biopolymer transport system component
VSLLCAVMAGAVTAGAGSPSPAAGGGEGAPDPDGRIAYGRLTRWDDFFGPVVALYAVDPDGTDEIQLTTGESAFPAWAPDGSRLAYTVHHPDGSWQIATMAADGTDVRILTSGPGVHEVPSWSPDGSWIAYDAGDPAEQEFHTVLHRVDADGSNAQILGDPGAFDVEPRISPDGRSVLFERLTFEGGSQSNTLMVRDVKTGAERALASAGTAVEHASWSPDGRWIIYNVSPQLSPEAARARIERVAADGGGQPALLFGGSDSREGSKPWYSPDGSRVAFLCTLDGGSEWAVCAMDADGTDVGIVADAPGVEEHYVSWGAAQP